MVESTWEVRVDFPGANTRKTIYVKAESRAQVRHYVRDTFERGMLGYAREGITAPDGEDIRDATFDD